MGIDSNPAPMTRKIWTLLAVLIFSVTLLVSGAEAPPDPSDAHIFYGNIANAPAGVRLNATINGGAAGSITTRIENVYGCANSVSCSFSPPQLVVHSSTASAGDAITFSVDSGSITPATYSYQPGNITKLDFTYTGTPASSNGGGGGGATPAEARDLGRFLEPFVQSGEANVQMVLGDNAPAEDVLAGIGLGMRLQYNLQNTTTIRLPNGSTIPVTAYDPLPLGTAVLASQFVDRDSNLILIGEPCTNPLFFPYLGITQETCKYFNIGESNSILKLVYDKGRAILLIIGKRSAQTRSAAQMLAQYENDGLEQGEVIITPDDILNSSCNSNSYCDTDESFFSCSNDCGVCIPDWALLKTPCKEDNSIGGFYVDNSNCSSRTHSPSVPPQNLTYKDVCDYDKNGIIGDTSHVNTSIIGLDILIGDSRDLVKNFSGVRNVIFKPMGTEKPLVAFPYDFDYSPLNLAKIRIEKQNSSANRGYLIVNGINLSSTLTKTVTIDNVNSASTFCIKDAEIGSIDEISPLCNGDDEFGITCPGNYGTYNCTFSDSTAAAFNISGLKHSGVQQQSYCGDGAIDSGETCSTCPADAGACPAPSGGGGGGGGGGSAAASESGFFGSMAAGMKKTIEYQKYGQLAVKSISLETKKEVNNVRIEVLMATKPLNAPNPVSDEKGKAYKYIRINPLNINNNDTHPAVIDFSVDKNWLENKSLDENKVTMMHYASLAWDPLDTKKTGSDADYYLYQAVTPGFSLFSITAEKKLPERKPEVLLEEQATQESEPTSLPEEDNAINAQNNTGTKDRLTASAVAELPKGSPIIGIGITAAIIGIGLLGYFGYIKRS